MSYTSKRSFSRLFLFLFGLLVAFSIVIAALLPFLASTKWGNEQLISIVNRKIPGTFSAEAISLSWFGPQKISGVSVKDPEGKDVLSLKQGEAESSLFSILLKDSLSHGFFLEGLNGTLSTDVNGNTNFEKALSQNCCQVKNPTSPLSATIQFKHVSAHVNLDQRKDLPITLQITGETLQKTESGKFAIDAELKGLTLNQLVHTDQKTLEELFAKGSAQFKVMADIVNFPIALIDQFVALKNPAFSGLLTEALGNQLNLKVSQHVTADGIEFSLEANSPKMRASSEMLLTNDLAIKKPLKIRFEATPVLIEALSSFLKTKFPFSLAAPATVELLIDTFRYPIKMIPKNDWFDFDLRPLTLNASLSVKEASLRDHKGGLIKLDGAAATFLAEPSDPEMSFGIKFEASQNGQPFGINFSGKITKPNQLRDLTEDWHRYLQTQGEVAAFPIGSIDSYFDLSGALIQVIGKTADIGLTLQFLKNEPVAEIRFKSDLLEIPSCSFSLGKEAMLTKPAIAKLNILPGLIENQAFGGSKESPRLREASSAIVKLNRLTFPLNNAGKQDNQKKSFLNEVTIDANISFSSLLMTQVPVVGDIALTDLNVTLGGKSLADPTCSIHAALSPINPKGILHDLLGEKTTLSASSIFSFRPGKSVEITDLDVAISSRLAKLTMQAKIQSDGLLTLQAPAVINYTLTTAGLRSMGLKASDTLLVQHGTPLEIRIAKTVIPLTFNQAKSLLLSGDVKVRDFSLISKKNPLDSQNSQATLDNLDIHWVFDGNSRQIKCDFDGVTRLGKAQAEGSFSGNAIVNGIVQEGLNIDFENSSLRLNARANNLPAAFVGSFLKETDLTPLIGDSIEAAISTELALNKTVGSLHMDLKSEHLSSTLNFRLDNGIFLNNKSGPAKFNLKLTPEGYAALRKHLKKDVSDLSLTEPAELKVSLRSLSVPWGNEKKSPIPFWDSAIDMDLAVDRLVATNHRTQEKIDISKLFAHIVSKDVAKHADFSINAEGKALNGLPSLISLKGSLENGFKVGGAINRNGLSLDLDGTISKLPVALLCQFACIDPALNQKLEAVLGNRFDAKIRANLSKMSGPFYLELKGENSTTVLDARLKDGTVYLNQNFFAELNATPQLGQYVLQELIPFLSGMQGSDQPLKLTISKEGFALPLRQFGIENVSIGDATLEFGKVRFSNQGQLAKVLSLLKTASANEFIVWLTPAYFSLTDGMFYLQRVDMLISDRYPIAAWGQVDIPNDQVNMAIGLSGAAIQKAFNVPGIKKSFMLQLPLRGTMRNASIDKSKVFGRLSSLVAQSQGGAPGLLLGTVLDIASGGLKEKAAPEPTTNPLPWNDLMKDSKDDSQTDIPEKAIKQVEKILPLEEIGTGAKNLLKKIFK